MPWRASLQSALLSLLMGWTVALAFAGIFTLLQRDAIFTAFPTATPDKANAEIQSRLERAFVGSPLLLLVQMGVTGGVLVWQIGKTSRRMKSAQDGMRAGLIAGALLAFAQTIMAVVLHTSWFITIPMIAVLVGAGGYGAWSGLQPHDR